MYTRSWRTNYRLLALLALFTIILATPISSIASLGAEENYPFVDFPIIEGFTYRPSVKGGAVDIKSMAWSPERPKVFVVGAERWVALVSADVGRERWINQIPVKGWVFEVDWAGDLIVVVAAKRLVEGAWINVWETGLIAYTTRGEIAWLKKYSGQPVLAVGQGLIAVTEMDAVEEDGGARMTGQRIVVYTFEGAEAWSLDLGASTVVLDAEWSPSGRYLAVEAFVTPNPISGAAEVIEYKVIVLDSQGGKVLEETYPADAVNDVAQAWARDGDLLAIAVAGPEGFKIKIIDVASGSVEEVSSGVQAGEIFWIEWTPFGEAWVAVSESGDDESILLAAKPGGDEAVRIEPEGGVPRYKPKWSPDGALAVNLSNDKRYLELRDGRLNLFFQAGPGFTVLNERAMDTLIQWIQVGDTYKLIAKSSFNEVRQYIVNVFSVVKLEGSGLSYQFCVTAPGLTTPACLDQLGGVTTLYMKPGSYTAEVRVTNAESLNVYGPVWNVKFTIDIEARPFEVAAYDLVGPFMERVGTLEIVYELPKRISFTLKILGADDKEYHKIVGVQGKEENATLRIKLVEGTYKVVASTKVTGLPVKLEKEVTVRPGETSKVDVNMETLGIGKLILLGGAVHTVTLSDGTEVYREMVHRGGKVVLYLPADTYKVKVEVDLFLLGGIEILGPGGDLSFTEEITVKPAEESTVDPLKILEENLARLKVENARGDAVVIFLVPFTEEGELVEMANLITLGPGEAKEYFIMPGYNYKVIDQDSEEVIAEIAPKPGEIITLTVSEKGATQETQTPTQTEPETEPTGTQTQTETGGEAKTGETAETPETGDEGGQSNTAILAGAGAAALILLLIVVVALARRR